MWPTWRWSRVAPKLDSGAGHALYSVLFCVMKFPRETAADNGRLGVSRDSLGQTEDAYMIVIGIVFWYLVLIK
jgi:hypothetical protein